MPNLEQFGRLVLSRKEGEAITIFVAGVAVAKVTMGERSLSVQAPPHIRILRSEVLEREAAA